MYCRGGGGKYVGRWLPDENGPAEDGDHSPGLPICVAPCSDESLLFGERFRCSPRTGELGRLPNGDAGNEDPFVGVRVKRNSLADNCQYVLLEMNISDQPSGVFSSGVIPTDESSDDTNPILSSFWIRFRPRSTPSRLIFMRHSPFGFAASGVFFDSSVVKCGDGSFR